MESSQFNCFIDTVYYMRSEKTIDVDALQELYQWYNKVAHKFLQAYIIILWCAAIFNNITKWTNSRKISLKQF